MLLVSIMATSWLLAASHSVVRPLFQVSDELSYVLTVQAKALELSPADRACILPPEGQAFDFPPRGGKFGFHNASALVLAGACRIGAGPLAIPLTRVALAITLPAIVGLTWWLGWLVAPHSRFVAPAAALSTATQPVIATFSGGMAPDGLANAASAGSLLVATHLVLNRPGGQWVLPMLLCAVAAIAAKDSALFLGPLTLLVVGAWSVQTSVRRAALTTALVGLGALVLASSGLLSMLSTPYPNLDTVLTWAIAEPTAFATIVVNSYVTHAGKVLHSALAGLANFGGGSLDLPWSLYLLQVAVLTVGIAAFVAACTAEAGMGTRLRRFAALVLAALLLDAVQIPVRQLMTDSLGPIQGRWLFPVWPLVIVACVIGWDTLLRRRAPAVLPLFSVGSALIAVAALVRIVGYYYRDWPQVFAWPNLFLYAAEGQNAGVDVARTMATATMVPVTLQAAVLVAATLSLLVVFVTSSGVARSAMAQGSSND